MGKADVTMTFDADTAAVVQKLLALKTQLDATGNSSREMGEKMGMAGQVAEAVGDKLVEMALSVATVEKAMGLATEAADEYFRRLQQGADAAMSRMESLENSLAKVGQIGQAKTIQNLLNEASTDLIGGQRYGAGFEADLSKNPPQLGNFLAQINPQIPHDATAEQRVNLARIAALGYSGGLPVESASALAATVGNLEMRTGMGQKEAESFARQILSSKSGQGLDEQEIAIIEESTPSQRDIIIPAIIASRGADVNAGRALKQALVEADKAGPGHGAERLIELINNPLMSGDTKLIPLMQALRSKMAEVAKEPPPDLEAEAATAQKSFPILAGNQKVQADWQNLIQQGGDDDEINKLVKSRMDYLVRMAHPVASLSDTEVTAIELTSTEFRHQAVRDVEKRTGLAIQQRSPLLPLTFELSPHRSPVISRPPGSDPKIPTDAGILDEFGIGIEAGDPRDVGVGPSPRKGTPLPSMALLAAIQANTAATRLNTAVSATTRPTTQPTYGADHPANQ